MNPRIAEIEKLAEISRDAPGGPYGCEATETLGSAVEDLPPGYLAAMAEVCEAAEAWQAAESDPWSREHDVNAMFTRLDDALARLRELEPKKEGNG